jgi:hypothetical protein
VQCVRTDDNTSEKLLELLPQTSAAAIKHRFFVTNRRCCQRRRRRSNHSVSPLASSGSVGQNVDELFTGAADTGLDEVDGRGELLQTSAGLKIAVENTCGSRQGDREGIRIRIRIENKFQ